MFVKRIEYKVEEIENGYTLTVIEPSNGAARHRRVFSGTRQGISEVLERGIKRAETLRDELETEIADSASTEG